MNKAVLLDRDGVINMDGSYVHKIEEFQFMDGIFDFCRAAQEKGYLLIVLTNQSGIGRGYYTEEDFFNLTNWMNEQFLEQNIQINKTYYCPYHPEKGIGKYKLDSEDRKPNPGMFLRAKEEFDLDMSSCIVVGDRISDMEAGRRAGVGKLILFPGKYEYEITDDVIAVNQLADILNYL